MAYDIAKIISMNNSPNENEQTDLKGDNTIKNPDDWTTGEQPMTGAQRSYLHTLASEAKEDVDDQLTKAEASKKIDDLQEKNRKGIESLSGLGL